MTEQVIQSANPETANEGISAITISGFKCFSKKQRIEIKPLTVFAGANSSGKSSFMQPVLLMRQTLQAPFIAEGLLLKSPDLVFDSIEEILSRISPKAKKLKIVFSINNDTDFCFVFKKDKDLLVVESIDLILNGKADNVFQTTEKIKIQIANINTILRNVIQDLSEKIKQNQTEIEKLSPSDNPDEINRLKIGIDELIKNGNYFAQLDRGFNRIFVSIYNIIHIPGIRKHPKIVYNKTSWSAGFSGSFEYYLASLIHQWQLSIGEELKKLISYLKNLGLARYIEVREIGGGELEIMVDRFPAKSQSDQKDMVSLKDVGFGISQVLPVLAALIAAKPGQIVYIEQPELHLHPRAQAALAEPIADAAKRGVRVIIETHSELLLLGIQTLIAEKSLPDDIVKLYWFDLNPNGSAKVTGVEPDENGAYGDWPEDFSDISLKAQSRYLDAAE